VDLLSVIRRWHRRDKLAIRKIARRTGLSRRRHPFFSSIYVLSPGVALVDFAASCLA
jgi:hypothetical protein